MLLYGPENQREVVLLPMNQRAEDERRSEASPKQRELEADERVGRVTGREGKNFERTGKQGLNNRESACYFRDFATTPLLLTQTKRLKLRTAKENSRAEIS